MNQAQDDDPFKDDDGDAGGGFIMGLAGATGSGKTFTGFRVARGAAAQALGLDFNNPEHLEKIDAAIAVIDTESRRALHYKARNGAQPSLYTSARGALFGFRHAELDAPYTPEAYYKLIDAADQRGYAVILIDSWSHEWDGEGGLMDMHDEIQDAMLAQAEQRARQNNNGNLPHWWRDDEQRDKLNIGAWNKPKRANKRLVNRMLRANAHIIICMRAEDKLRIETEREARTKRNGDTYEIKRTKITAPGEVPVGQRWVPICEKRLPFEFTVGFVLTPETPGRPYPMKTLQAQLRPLFDLEQPLDEASGARLASWARTGAARANEQQPFSIGAATPPQATPGGGATSPAPPPPLSDQASDDFFPGDLPPPEDDETIVEERKYGGRIYASDQPCAIEPRVAIMEAESADLKGWAATLRDMIQFAPSNAVRAEWKNENAANLLRLTNRSQALHGWTLEHLPPDSAPVPGADDGAASQQGAGGGAAPSKLAQGDF